MQQTIKKAIRNTERLTTSEEFLKMVENPRLFTNSAKVNLHRLGVIVFSSLRVKTIFGKIFSPYLWNGSNGSQFA